MVAGALIAVALTIGLASAASSQTLNVGSARGDAVVSLRNRQGYYLCAEGPGDRKNLIVAEEPCRIVIETVSKHRAIRFVDTNNYASLPDDQEQRCGQTAAAANLAERFFDDRDSVKPFHLFRNRAHHVLQACVASGGDTGTPLGNVDETAAFEVVPWVSLSWSDASTLPERGAALRPLVIVAIGETGIGKSSTLNNILPCFGIVDAPFASAGAASLRPTTNDIRCHTFELAALQGRPLVLCDIPGLTNGRFVDAGRHFVERALEMIVRRTGTITKLFVMESYKNLRGQLSRSFFDRLLATNHVLSESGVPDAVLHVVLTHADVQMPPSIMSPEAFADYPYGDGVPYEVYHDNALLGIEQVKHANAEFRRLASDPGSIIRDINARADPACGRPPLPANSTGDLATLVGNNNYRTLHRHILQWALPEYAGATIERPVYMAEVLARQNICSGQAHRYLWHEGCNTDEQDEESEMELRPEEVVSRQASPELGTNDQRRRNPSHDQDTSHTASGANPTSTPAYERTDSPGNHATRAGSKFSNLLNRVNISSWKQRAVPYVVATALAAYGILRKPKRAPTMTSRTGVAPRRKDMFTRAGVVLLTGLIMRDAWYACNGDRSCRARLLDTIRRLRSISLA